MCGVTTRAGVAESTHICETCPSLYCSCTHFVHTIKGEKVVKILNVGLKGRRRLRLKEITAAYQFDCESITTAGDDTRHNSSSASLLQKSLVQRCERICAEIDAENFIDLDDYGMTLTEFKNSLGKAKKKQKVLRSGISGNGDCYGPCSIVSPERSDPSKEETTELEEPLSCYILKLKGKKVTAQKCLKKIPDFSSAASGENFVPDYSMQDQYVSNVFKREEPGQDVKHSMHSNIHSPHNLPCLNNTSTNTRNVKDTHVSCAIKEEVDLNCGDDCSESYLDNCSSVPCPVDTNLPSGSTRDERKEDKCKDQMQEVDFFASENIVYLSCAGLPPKVDEATKKNILQPCSQDSSHKSISQACSYFSSLDCDTNVTSTDECHKESNILGYSRMINLAPVCSKVNHEVTCPTDNCSDHDNCSSVPCPVDANLSFGLTRDKNKEDSCKDQMQEVDFFASENIVFLSCAGLPPKVDEAAQKNILQPYLQDISHNSISQACSYFSSLDCNTNLMSTDECPKESNILSYSRMINLAPACSEEVTILEAEDTFPLVQCLLPTCSVTDQRVISTEYKSTSCPASSQKDLLREAKASLDSVRNNRSAFMDSSYDRSEQDDEASADADEESKSSCYNIPNDDSSPQKSTLPSGSSRFSNASSSIKEVSQHASVQVVYPAECFASNAVLNCKRKILSSNDAKTLAVHDGDSISPGENIQVVEVNVTDPDFQSQSTSPAISSSLDNASSYFGEFSKMTVGQTVCPGERFTSDVVLNQKRKVSPNYVDDWKLRKHPRILLSSRKVPTSQKRLQRAMDTQEHSRTHLSRLNLEDTQLPLNAFDIECKSNKSLDDSSPSSLMEKSSKNLAHGCASTETDAQKAIRFSQRQMHDIESLAAKLLKKLKCMKNIVEETLRYAASPSTPLKYTDEEIRGAAESASELEDGTRRLLAMMARDCNRFCKIMNSTGKKGSHVKLAPKERKKIMFADEAGGELCHVKVFEDVNNQADSDAR